MSSDLAPRLDSVHVEQTVGRLELGRLAAHHREHPARPAAPVAFVSEIETVAAHMSQKIWQKTSLLPAP